MLQKFDENWQDIKTDSHLNIQKIKTIDFVLIGGYTNDDKAINY